MDVSVFGGEYNVVGIEVRKQGEEGVLVELRGKFDRGTTWGICRRP